MVGADDGALVAVAGGGLADSAGGGRHVKSVGAQAQQAGASSVSPTPRVCPRPPRTRSADARWSDRTSSSSRVYQTGLRSGRVSWPSQGSPAMRRARRSCQRCRRSCGIAIVVPPSRVASCNRVRPTAC
ncbi:hypothetical protein ACFQZ4_06140 [Catellatospora coxensis]